MSQSTTSTDTDGAEPREPLDRARVLAAAVELADRHGVDALSMRKLARHLGYEVMSLYNHVAGKDDLLDGMVDLVAAEIEDPPAGLTWRPAVRHIAVSAHESLLRHRWASTLWSSRWPGPHRWRHMETLLAVLTAADFPDDVADLAFHAVTLHISGFTQQQISYRAQADREAELYDQFSSEVSAEEFPHVVAHVQYHQDQHAPPDEFGSPKVGHSVGGRGDFGVSQSLLG